ncbi:MAG: hypothetical protein Q8O30_10645 [Candidatus Omnitrophota bacterium]|nr:hypothetical protein [Candidatus Omnitrophota bacterium]
MEKKIVSLKNIVIGILIGMAVMYGLSHIETNDEKTVRLICASGSFLFAIFFLFLSWKIDMTEDIFIFLARFKKPTWDPFHWFDEDGRFNPKGKMFIRIYYLLGCLVAIAMGLSFFFIFK